MKLDLTAYAQCFQLMGLWMWGSSKAMVAGGGGLSQPGFPLFSIIVCAGLTSNVKKDPSI